jgi:fructose-specific phosphotransferase system IIC component
MMLVFTYLILQLIVPFLMMPVFTYLILQLIVPFLMMPVIQASLRRGQLAEELSK